MNFGFNENNNQSMEKCCASPETPMTFVDRSMDVYHALVQTNDILDKISVLLSGDCLKESEDEGPQNLSHNIELNQRMAAIIRDRVRSLACILGVKD